MYGLPQGHSKLGGGELSLVAYMERLHPKRGTCTFFSLQDKSRDFTKGACDIDLSFGHIMNRN